jgi:hypothetical protein
MNENLQKWLDELNNKPITYKFLKQMNFSFLNYLYTKLNFYNYSIINGLFENKVALKSLVFEFYSSLKNATVTMGNFNINENDNIDFEYLQFINDSNEKIKDNNKNFQKVKLIMIFDTNQIFKISQKNIIIKWPLINEIELIFNDDIVSTSDLLIFFNSYLSDIEHLENINKIMFHNKMKNQFNIINNSFYQSLVSYLFEDINAKKNENIKAQIQLLKSLKEIYIENIPFLYVYERMKLYYYINDLFLSSNPNKNIYSIHDKFIIFNNKNEEMKIDEIISSIEYHLNNNKKIHNLLFVNHKKCIKTNSEINKINISNFPNIKEFMYIDEELDNLNEIFDINISLNKSKNKKNRYIGYNKDNKLIFYREGEEQIQSFDLIDLFKYVKNLTTIKLINENIRIYFNEERTKLIILNKKLKKSELSAIINYDFLNISHFSKFIYNQDSLIELTILGFDINLIDIINNNITTLNLNYYSKKKLLLKYLINVNDCVNQLGKYFPKLTSLNIGGDCKNVFNSLNKILTQQIKTIGIITRKETTRFISKIFKKIHNYKFTANIKFLDEQNDIPDIPVIAEENKDKKNDKEDEEEFEEDFIDISKFEIENK